MKMTKEHYEVLKGRIQPMVPKLPAYIEQVKAAGGYKDLNKRILWDIFHACRMYDVYNYHEFDYYDSHIETALKTACKDLGIAIH